jgi:hypothetical protein
MPDVPRREHRVHGSRRLRCNRTRAHVPALALTHSSQPLPASETPELMPDAANHSAAPTPSAPNGQKALRRTSRTRHPGRLQGARQHEPDLPVPRSPNDISHGTEKPCLLSITTKAARPARGSRPCPAARGRRQQIRPAARPRPAGNPPRQPRSEAHRRESAPARSCPPAPGKPGRPTGSPRTVSAVDAGGKLAG